MAGYEWRPARTGDDLPMEAVLAGKSSTDGPNYVARVGNEAGKVNLDGVKVNNFWCHDSGKSNAGDLLCLQPGFVAVWEHKERGDPLPDGAVCAGVTDTDGQNFVCRNAGAAGKVNVKDGHVNNFWMHGNFFAKREGDILVVRRRGDQGPGPSPAQEPVPPHAASAPEAPHAQPEQHHEWHPQPGGSHGYGFWNPDVECDGSRAEDRAQWLIQNRGMDVDAARQQVMSEFPFLFREGYGANWWQDSTDCGGIPAGNRVRWLMENEGYSEDAAKLKVKSEFPDNFRGGGDFIGGSRFPHTLSLVDTDAGPRLKIEVLVNAENVALAAVHYRVNGGAPMNFDIREPEPGSRTYVHVTPNGGGYPLCRSGDQVSYWLAAQIDNIIQSDPEDAPLNAQARLQWTAHH